MKMFLKDINLYQKICHEESMAILAGFAEI